MGTITQAAILVAEPATVHDPGPILALSEPEDLFPSVSSPP
jgi:hypothetical protein